MTTLRITLEARREEFDAHFALAQALENRMILESDGSIGDIYLSARHINTIKSGLIIHLYNIEEAVMSQALQYLGEALGSADPRKWTEHSLREWLRESIINRIGESNEDGRLKTVCDASTLLLTMPALRPQKLKKPAGTWDDKLIAVFIKRMRVTCNLPPEIWRQIAKTPTYGDKTPLQFLAKRRNDIAHGKRSFEEGASDLELSKIRTLADVTLDYMGFVADAFQSHVESDAHLVTAT